jgi:hypothetical protein
MSNDIGWAVQQMRDRKRVTRLGWSGQTQYVALQFPDNYSKMDLPYLYAKTATGELVPWVLASGDLLATDWSIIA